jgi:hypothetical protein
MDLMSLVTYSKSSWLYTTPQTNLFLANYVDRGLARDSTDILQPFLNARYNLRPDLLSFDLYGVVDYRWTFILLNPDLIVDPIYDFVTGIQIYTATLDRLKSQLGG